MEEGERRTRILVVEDETIVALDMQNQLAEMGYDVVAMATSGEEAVSLARESSPEIILMDIRLKGKMDGVEAAERIRLENDIPVIFITAYADERTLSRAKVTEAFGYILKPFQGREVLISIEMALYKHRTESALRGNREWLKGTLDAIADAVISLDTDDRVEFMNRAAESLLRLDRSTVRGRPLEEFCTFSESPALSGLRAARLSANARGDESWMVMETPSGKTPVELVRTLISSDGKGSPSGRVISIRDISELVRAVETRSRLAAIVANSYDAILAVAGDLRIVSWNFGAELMYGYGSGEVIGKSLLDLIPDDKDRTQFRAVADKILAGHDAERFELFRKCRSGKAIPVSVSLSPVRDAEGRVVELACIERDISAEKEYEASLIKAKLTAEEGSRVKGEFLSNMSHELRTPLNSIIGMIDLSRAEALTAEQGEYLGIARQSADNLLFLINSILDFAKIESGKMRINEIPFNLAGTIADCIETLSVQAYQKGLFFRFRFDPACPNGVIGDPLRLSQILANLFSNAIKFTESGGIRVDLTFAPQPGGEEIVATIKVRDTGIGIPKDRLETIWDKFTQVDGSSTRSYGGTGLGLAIVKSLANLMGGTVSVESELKRGSEFTVELPFPVAPRSGPTAEAMREVSGAEIAVAVQDPSERAILAELLTAWGCVPREMGDARSLVDLVRASGAAVPRLILADENLPGRDLLFEYAADEAFRALMRDSVTVLVDGLGTKEQRWRGLSGARRFLIKPVRYDALLENLLSIPARKASDPRIGEPPAGNGGAARGAPKESAAEGDSDSRLREEIRTRPGAKEELERFFGEIGPFADMPSAHLESAASRCRKTLEDLRSQELPRTLFKIILACRRGDEREVARGLESIRTALGSS